MAERVGSDHPSVTTLRGRLVRRGGTRRPAVAMPESDADAPPAGETVRLVLDGQEYHAPTGERGGMRTIVGAYDNARRARDREGQDRLAEWVDGRDLEFGRSVLVDVVEPGEAYGLRVPGEDAVYAVDRGPPDALRRIAEDLDS